jgi:hypothetical protein
MSLKQRLRRFLNPPGDVENALYVRPASERFGYERGTPIDRFYIDQFLEGQRHLIRGRTLEIAGNNYTLKFGPADVQSLELHTRPLRSPSRSRRAGSTASFARRPLTSSTTSELQLAAQLTCWPPGVIC